MTTLFEDLFEGLQEAIAYAKGEGEGKETLFNDMSLDEIVPQ